MIARKRNHDARAVEQRVVERRHGSRRRRRVDERHKRIACARDGVSYPRARIVERCYAPRCINTASNAPNGVNNCNTRACARARDESGGTRSRPASPLSRAPRRRARRAVDRRRDTDARPTLACVRAASRRRHARRLFVRATWLLLRSVASCCRLVLPLLLLLLLTVSRCDHDPDRDRAHRRRREQHRRLGLASRRRSAAAPRACSRCRRAWATARATAPTATPDRCADRLSSSWSLSYE